MSYFEGLKLTKKGEQLQAKINGNLSETLTFTKAKLGSGSITSNDEIRFLTDVKEEWGTANVASCKIQGNENNIVAIELQFSNAGLREDKIFREIGLYARGNEGDEILYAYANAGDKYDYIPLMKDSPHSFVIVIYFNITSSTKVDANIDLHSYITLQEFNEGMSKKINKTDYASAEQYGIVKYGAEEGTVLEGNKFTQMIGKDYGGILNEPGTKEVGKTYFDKNTKKLYLCKNNNTDISANVNNYIAMDSNSLLERLENLSIFKVQDLYSSPMGVKFTVYQYGSLIMITAYTYNVEKLNYGIQYKCNLPHNCYNTATAITGNDASSGQFSLVNNVLIVNSTNAQVLLKNTFMGQLTTFLRQS